MRSGVWIGAAMAVLSVRLLAGGGDASTPEPVAASAASAAAALLADAAVSAPVVAPALPEGHGGALAGSAPAGGAVAPSSERVAAAAQAMQAASVEAEVRLRRARGDDEDAVYRLRAAQLPAADVARLMAMEAAEASWRRQLAASPDGCATSCEATAEHVVASAYRHDAAPRLTVE